MSVSTIIFDSTSSDWFYTTGEDVTEDQDPVEEEPDPVEGTLPKRVRDFSFFFPQRLKDGLTFQNTMPRKGWDKIFDGC
jgi:hypothetical protein